MTVPIQGEEKTLDYDWRDTVASEISSERDLHFIKRAPLPMWSWHRGESSRGGGAQGHQQEEPHHPPPMSDSSGEEPPTPPTPPSDQEQYLWYDKHVPSSTTTTTTTTSSSSLRLPFPLALTAEEFQHHQARRREELTRQHEEEKVRREHRKNLDRYQKRKMRRAERKARQEEAEERARFPSEEYYNTFFDTIQKARFSGVQQGVRVAETLRMMILVPEMTQPRETADIDEDAKRFLEQYEQNKQPRISNNLPGWVGELQRRYQRHVDNLGLLEYRREQELKTYGGVASDEVDILIKQEARGAVQQFRYLQNNFQSKYEMAKSIARGEYVVDDDDDE